MEHAYKLLYLLRPVIWGLFVFLIGEYGNQIGRVNSERCYGVVANE